MKQVAAMEHESEGRVLAQIERRLASEDPALAARMSALNEQFQAGRRKEPSRWNWRKRTALAVIIIAIVGLILTVVLSASPAEDPPPPPNGLTLSTIEHVPRGNA
ncbi:hypothetical protein AR457_32510 [Streptomyces agglomeratus]|uniref:DUF3040 domain-containing protein n=1 Tax=Streptomyces agglomeratus TaxID=285458 RepID=A0A1E5PG48_9ACTN|nr:DUF3040 domain-containing protein [Streptomyces agglomeratus]OEJ28491.1 hypothetical protein AS594_32420 [Streptomyces agglomeratus]OEJ37446.1 hypothetical protein BGK70_04145 [Streptomyces agglomeratus]OEJ48170.1 hypothetical protein AR457_32510 [Streptomyces agglomeratus]OEJ49987.1 hypothetical protein BGK72_03655 [Streptomyces agglomeratus]OEJ57315.1 hypothetical protein BGM19_04335 [Streptomyces agglomeratus]